MELNELFYQNYWWFLISLLGALLVFLLFVQGGQTMLTGMAKTPLEKTMLVNSLGRKWEFTFTTLVVFGGAFSLRSRYSILPVSAVHIGYGWQFFLALLSRPCLMNTGRKKGIF